MEDDPNLLSEEFFVYAEEILNSDDPCEYEVMLMKELIAEHLARVNTLMMFFCTSPEYSIQRRRLLRLL